MRRSKATAQDFATIREAFLDLKPGAAHQANEPPDLNEIFTPALHAAALDPQRPLVVGNRGVGKSFWSSVLTDSDAREVVAEAYPRVPLSRMRASLGFHEAAGKDEGPAPSQRVLASLLKQGAEPEEIWRAVLLKALRDHLDESLPESIKDILAWHQQDLERSEVALRGADRLFSERNEFFVLVFDALDRLGRDWSDVSKLTEGILRLALDMRGFRRIRAKIFMRADQANDDRLFRFPDASKLRSDVVDLVWRRGELFGLLYAHLFSGGASSTALSRLLGGADAEDYRGDSLEDEELQEKLFYRIAGEYMGAGPKRGRTYSWLYDHLADTFGETSPRSFITAIRRAAEHQPPPKDLAIDHHGIRAGVQDASRVRVDQLKEDYFWITKVLSALDGLEVPCHPSFFINRWDELDTIAELRRDAGEVTTRLPLELFSTSVEDDALLNALKNIGVVEFRAENRINVPDIFRVEAGIKRRGGVRPPVSRRR